MAPTIKWQRFEAAAYNWLGTTATDAVPQIESELSAWMAAVNANPSNTGRQLSIEKGYADYAGSGNYMGWVIKAGANNNTAFGYLQYISSSTSGIAGVVSSVWDDNGSNGGYGAMTTIGVGSWSDVPSHKLSDVDSDFLLVSDTLDGKEFFILGKRQGTSANYMDGFVIVKTLTGEWVIALNDNSTYGALAYFDDEVATGWDTTFRGNTYTSSSLKREDTHVLDRWCLTGANATITTTNTKSYSISAASDLLLSSSSGGSTGDRHYYNDIGNGDEVYLLFTFYYGPRVLVDLRS